MTAMHLLNPLKATYFETDAPTRRRLTHVIAFFEQKGLQKLKHDDRERVWYDDFLQLVKDEQLFATFLTPQKEGDGTTRWDTWRNSLLNEILGFYGLNYWYPWQVTLLGLGPIWMSSNAALRRETARLLREGAIFGFGLSEKEHGADLYSTDMLLTDAPEGGWLANGSKYYIGNGNKGAIIATFGKIKATDDYVFFAARPAHPRYTCVKNIVNTQNYVAEYRLDDYPVTENDIMSLGREAWDSALNTINIGKYNLGWASIGLCSHAFYEAIDHASRRRLFDHYVTDFPHIRRFFTDAYARLCAMKFYAQRASDYMRAASKEDRRYLLYNPIQKMKVTSQGEAVINLLWDVIAAKGFEKDTFFEMAARDIRALPKLEGTVHVNMALIIKFMAHYFFKPVQYPPVPRLDGVGDDAFLFRQGETKGLSRIQFHDYRAVYNGFDLPNIQIFKTQIRWLKRMLAVARPTREQAADFGFLFLLGEMFTLVVYGQLILENTAFVKVSDALLDSIFHFMVRDFASYALQWHNHRQTTARQRWMARRMYWRPHYDDERFEALWREEIMPLAGSYTMHP